MGRDHRTGWVGDSAIRSRFDLTQKRRGAEAQGQAIVERKHRTGWHPQSVRYRKRDIGPKSWVTQLGATQVSPKTFAPLRLCVKTRRPVGPRVCSIPVPYSCHAPRTFAPLRLCVKTRRPVGPRVCSIPVPYSCHAPRTFAPLRLCASALKPDDPSAQESVSSRRFQVDVRGLRQAP